MSKFLKKILGIVLGTILLFIVVCCLVYKINTGKVSNDDTLKEIVVEQGSTYYSLASLLKENNLIKSEIFYQLYIKINQPVSLQAGKYSLSENMNVAEIISILSQGSTYNPDAIRVTFKEGINMRKIATLIEENTNHTKDEVYKLLQDEAYLDELITKYWFLTEEIKNKKIYYSLEGYLFPDTYELKNKDVSIKEIFAVMLNQMDKKLTPYKEKIETSTYSIHDILTLASIVELESANKQDRAKVAGVFYNRLNHNWSLGSDVTTYYAEKVDMGERDLYQSELDDYNAYNTRNANMAGKLPVSPICIPGLESIVATIEPEIGDYYYFVADKNKKVYFTKNLTEHNKIIATLKEEGLWYVY